MKRLFVLVPVLLAVMPAGAAPAAQTAMYRSGRAAVGTLQTAAPEGGAHQFSATFVWPSTGNAFGYLLGSGVIATPPQPGFVDLAKPWLVFTKSGAQVICHSVTNVTQFTSYDGSDGSSLALYVPCADGVNTGFYLSWTRHSYTNFAQIAWPYRTDPFGSPSLVVHGLRADATFTVCGDVSPCASRWSEYWRIYDAHASIARSS